MHYCVASPSSTLQYDNVVMEEAAQILEVETFIPLMLQNTEDGVSRLKRVILIGDHHQVSFAPLTTPKINFLILCIIKFCIPFIFPFAVASSHKKHGFSEIF